jgi:hypothetical protein
MQPGQVVSAIAGLNSLTMKKRMIQTLNLVGGGGGVGVAVEFCKLRPLLVLFDSAGRRLSPSPCWSRCQRCRPCCRAPAQALGAELARQVAPVSFCLPEELPQWEAWLKEHPEADTGARGQKGGGVAAWGWRPPLWPHSALNICGGACRVRPRPQMRIRTPRPARGPRPPQACGC